MGKEPPTGSHQITLGWYVRRWCLSIIFNRGPKFWHWNHHTIFPAEVLTHRSCKKAVRKLVWNPLDLWWHEGSNSHPSIAPRVVIFDHHGSSRSAAHQAEASRLQMGSVLGMRHGLFLAYSPKNERKTVYKTWKSPPLNSIFQTFNFEVFYVTLQETNISPKNGILKMIFLFPRWDMLIPWRVLFRGGSIFLRCCAGSRPVRCRNRQENLQQEESERSEDHCCSVEAFRPQKPLPETEFSPVKIGGPLEVRRFRTWKPIIF